MAESPKRSAELVHQQVIASLSALVARTDKPGKWVFDGKDGRPSYTAWQNWQTGAAPRLSHLCAVAARLKHALLVRFVSLDSVQDAGSTDLSDRHATPQPPTTEAGMDELETQLLHWFRALPNDIERAKAVGLLEGRAGNPSSPVAASPARDRLG